MSNLSNDFIRAAIQRIRETVGQGKANIALSGGVDSAVTAVLAWRALKPKQLMIFTIDDGLRREGEPEWVVKVFKEVEIQVDTIQVQDKYLKALKGIVNGDKRRRIYSNMFGVTCGKATKDFGANYAFFGTNALDREETKAGAQRQHNAWKDMGIDPETKYGFKVVEPLKTLYKNQIRELARNLFLSPEISGRMPFPGPGLAIRMLESVTPERVNLMKEVTEIIEKNLFPLKPFQCLSCLLKGVATGRREGKGFFGKIISVRCVDSTDSGQTAIPTLIPIGIQQRITNQILVSLPQVARVVFDQTPKPPGRIEYI